MQRTPTDLKILTSIYNRYFHEFRYADRESRSAKNYVPIDIRQVARDLRMDENVLFGRLYYDLDRRYRYRQDDGAYVHLFSLVVGDDRHAIHLPYLAGILAKSRSDWNRFWIATVIASISLAVSILSLWLSVSSS